MPSNCDVVHAIVHEINIQQPYPLLDSDSHYRYWRQITNRLEKTSTEARLIVEPNMSCVETSDRSSVETVIALLTSCQCHCSAIQSGGVKSLLALHIRCFNAVDVSDVCRFWRSNFVLT